jgi:hypothetical protein
MQLKLIHGLWRGSTVYISFNLSLSVLGVIAVVAVAYLFNKRLLNDVHAGAAPDLANVEYAPKSFFDLCLL